MKPADLYGNAGQGPRRARSRAVGAAVSVSVPTSRLAPGAGRRPGSARNEVGVAIAREIMCRGL